MANEVLFDEAQGDDEIDTNKEEKFEDARPLAEELIDTMIDLLFYSDFTLPRQPSDKPKVSYAIWQSGVGCHTAVATTKEFESNRCEILRLLLTLTGQSMYMAPTVLPTRGVRSLTYLCTSQDKQVVLSVLCSLLNTTLKFHPSTWRVPYNSLLIKDTKLLLVTDCVQLLLSMLLYPIPESASAPSQKNSYRHFLGRLHRPQDFQFIVDGMSRILTQPLQDKGSYIPGTQAAAVLAPETLMLFWETVQCNRRFRAYIIDTDRSHDFVILALFYALEYKNDLSKQGIVRMCVFILQTLSVEKSFGVHLNKRFERQETLPTCIRINGFVGTYADFLLHSIYNLITTSQGSVSSIYPALLAVINNVAPYLEGLSASSSAHLMLLFSRMSSPSFVLANETNHQLLRSLLEAINALVEHQYQKNPHLVMAILKNRKKIEGLRNFTLEGALEEMERRNRQRKDSESDSANNSTRSSVDNLRSPKATAAVTESIPEEDAFAIGEEDSDDDEPQATPAASSRADSVSRSPSTAAADEDVPSQLPGMSEKARGKMPAGRRDFSRQNSTTSLGSTSAGAPSHNGAFAPTAQWIDSWLPELPLHTLLTLVQQMSSLLEKQLQGRDTLTIEALAKIEECELMGVEPSPIRVQSFEWTALSLAWYESLLWGIVFANELQMSKGSLGIWNGTSIQLFRVQETAATGPSLASPRGAVDAVGSNIVSRIGQMNLRGAAGNVSVRESPGQGGRQ